MADDVDFASTIEEAVRDEAVHQTRALLTAEGADSCEDCGSRIKAARRRAMPSARTCAPCQTERETPRRVGGQ